jgi:hypothetical protein
MDVKKVTGCQNGYRSSNPPSYPPFQAQKIRLMLKDLQVENSKKVSPALHGGRYKKRQKMKDVTAL